MLEEGYIVAGNPLPRLYTWQVSDPVLHAFLVGTLATLLAYQITALVLDLSLGWKKPGEVTVADLFTLLRSEDLSFRYVYQIFRRDDDHDDPEELAKEEESTLDSNSEEIGTGLSKTFMFKLFFILAAVPAINMLAIFLTLETDTTVSFRSANFGGIAFGLPPNGSALLHTRDVSQSCTRILPNLETVVHPIASFFMCIKSNVIPQPSEQDPASRVILEARADGEVEVRILDASDHFVASRRLEMMTEGQLYRLPHSITKEQAIELVKAGGEVLAAGCTQKDAEGGVPPVNVIQEGRRVQAEQVFTCEEQVPVTMKDAFYEIALRIDTVDDKDLLVAKLEESELGSEKLFEFTNGDGLPFYRWRGSYASVLVLAILVACTLTARLVVTLFTHNDIHLGLELIIKDQLGLNYADSMLQNGSSFQYERVNIWGRTPE